MSATDALEASDPPLTQQFLTTTAGDRCAGCQSLLAPDQRYCLACGERRGRPRFSAEPEASPGSLAARSSMLPGGPGVPPEPARLGPAPGATLVGGVATLLIAMGVGVLIGHNSSSTPQRASAPVQVVTLGGATAAGSGALPAPTHAAGGSRRHPTAAHAAVKKAKPVIVHVSPKVSAAAAQAATHVFGSGGTLAPNVTQTQGGSCSGGAGCQNGKFTGSFFGQ